jgi:hypothetical protein
LGGFGFVGFCCVLGCVFWMVPPHFHNRIFMVLGVFSKDCVFQDLRERQRAE